MHLQAAYGVSTYDFGPGALVRHLVELFVGKTENSNDLFIKNLFQIKSIDQISDQSLSKPI